MKYFYSILILTLLLGCSEDDNNEVFESHNQGADCKSCHSTFGAAGTIYTSLGASTASSSTVAANNSAKLTFADGSVLSMNVAKGSGNIYTTSTIAQTFTVSIINENGSVVKSSSTHALSSTKCNTCHTSTGVNGAPGRIINN